MEGKHFHTIEIMVMGGVGALILFNALKMLFAHGISRNDLVGDISRAGMGLVK